ncbi:hypothetical protein V8F33_006091 [Rhypophila sp. PSN 637]
MADPCPTFTLFPRLPAELCLLIWELALNPTPDVISLRYRDGQLVSISIPRESLVITCKESYNIYKKDKYDSLVFHEIVWKYLKTINDQALAIQKKGKEHTFPVNFGRDFFYISGVPPPDLVPNEKLFSKTLQVVYRQPFVSQLKKVILPTHLSGCISDLFYSSRHSELQELWVLLRECGEGFRPEPGSEFQQHSPVHHHDKSPSKYCRIDDPLFWSGGKSICPACDWESSNWGDIDRAAIRSQYHNFMITYDASLLLYPRLSDLSRAKIPVIRWVRKESF